MKIIEEQTTDEVLEETRRIKEALGKRFDFDIDRIIDSAIENQNKSGKNILLPQEAKAASS